MKTKTWAEKELQREYKNAGIVRKDHVSTCDQQEPIYGISVEEASARLIHATYLNSGILTVNEAREIFSLEGGKNEENTNII